VRAKKEPEKMAVIKPKVYIETTVVSYFIARPSRDLLIAGHQEATREVWPRLLEEFDPYISALVLQEAGRGDAQAAKERLAAIQTIPVLDINPLSQTLAAQLLKCCSKFFNNPETCYKTRGCEIILRKEPL
jgi:hypothetical protein